MSSFVKKGVDVGIRTLLYFGDTDTVCNYLMGQKFSANLGYELLHEKEPWYAFKGQVGGLKTSYEKGLTFTTVR